MSSSPASAGKRKRSTSQSLSVQAPKSKSSLPSADLLQPSSCDASGEDGGDESAGSGVPSPDTHQLKNQPSSTSSVPALKRARTSNGTTDQATVSKEDPGEPSETTVQSSDIESRNGHGNRKEMKPPERAGLMDPVGYHTNPPPVGRPVRVYADGVFDLFHMGYASIINYYFTVLGHFGADICPDSHMRQLEQAKKAFPDVHLIVGVTGDKETHDRKGLTVLSGAERAETIRHCKWVDEVLPNCPWIVTPEFIDEHRIDYVAHDDLPYGADEGDDIYAPIKAQGKFLVTQRTEGVSTTGVITRYIPRYFVKTGAGRLAN